MQIGSLHWGWGCAPAVHEAGVGRLVGSTSDILLARSRSWGDVSMSGWRCVWRVLSYVLKVRLV